MRFHMIVPWPRSSCWHETCQRVIYGGVCLSSSALPAIVADMLRPWPLIYLYGPLDPAQTYITLDLRTINNLASISHSFNTRSVCFQTYVLRIVVKKSDKTQTLGIRYSGRVLVSTADT